MENETFLDRVDNMFGFFNSGHDLENYEEDEEDFSHFDAVFDSMF